MVMVPLNPAWAAHTRSSKSLGVLVINAEPGTGGFAGHTKPMPTRSH